MEESEKENDRDEDIISTEEIDYSAYIEKYTMPFEFLTQLLVVTEEPDFCNEVVKQALNGKIIINIQEEETVTNTTETREYTVHSKDNKSIDYNINVNAENKTKLEEQTNYRLNLTKDDEGNDCTNYSSTNLTVEITRTNTSHSYKVEIIEADTWIAKYKKEYHSSNRVDTTNNDTVQTFGDYGEIKIENVQLSKDGNVQKFINDKVGKYESKIIIPPDHLEVANKEDEHGKYKEVVIPDGFYGRSDESGYLISREVYDVDGNLIGTTILANRAILLSSSVDRDDVSGTAEIPKLEYIYTFNSVQNIYNLSTVINPLVTCDVTKLEVKNLEKIDVTVKTATTVTKFQTDSNPKTNTHIYATESEKPGKGHGDTDTVYEKFLLAYDNSASARNQLNSIDSWLFEMMEKRDTTVELVDVIKYLLYMYDGKTRGVTELDTEVFVPSQFKNFSNSYGVISINETTLTKDEFVNAVRNYSTDDGYQTRFAQWADVIYDVCVEHNINPVVCVAVACQESGFGKYVGGKFNYWGIAVYNDTNSGTSYATMEEAVEAWCKVIIAFQTPGTEKYNIASEHAGTFSGFSDKFNPDVVSIYDVWAGYAHLGDKHSGKMWADVNVKEFIVKWLKMECNHSEEDLTTDEEKAAYIIWYVDNGIVENARNIFGDKALNSPSSSVVDVALKYLGKTGREMDNLFNLFSYTDCTGNNSAFYPSEWCAMFVSFCYSECNLIPGVLDASFAGVSPFVEYHSGLRRDKNEYTPQPGDLAIYDWSRKGRI